MESSQAIYSNGRNGECFGNGCMGLSKSMRVLVMAVVTQCHATISVAGDAGRVVGV